MRAFKGRPFALGFFRRFPVAGVAASFCLFFSGPVLTAAAGQRDLRPAAVAGKFYPADPVQLKKAVRQFLSDAVPPVGKRPVALVSPHAGYLFSGQIAADAFVQARGYPYDLIVLLGVNHTTPGFKGVSVFPKGGFQTPLGVAEIDAAVAKELLGRFPEARADASVHRKEHSIEVLLPFVQVLFPKTPILPLIVSLKDAKACARFGKGLGQLLSRRKALIVASSDLSHYPGYADACRLDPKTLQAMASLDIQRFQQVVRAQEASGVLGLSTCACGFHPVAAAMAAARSLGACSGAVVSYANSGDALVGNRRQVVGYGAVLFTRQPARAGRPFCPQTVAPVEAGPLSRTQEEVLLAFARKTLVQYFETGTVPLPRPADPMLYARQGAFVTLKRHGRLRGCIGRMTNDLPRCQVVGRTALQAAFNDRRFPPLEAGELNTLEIEISMLSPLRRVPGPEAIVVGRDGVMLEKSGRSAVFLPQVAPEQGWNREQMLSHLCRKAGLPESAWKQGATFYTFQAQVFGESPPQP